MGGVGITTGMKKVFALAEQARDADSHDQRGTEIRAPRARSCRGTSVKSKSVPSPRREQGSKLTSGRDEGHVDARCTQQRRNASKPR